MEIKQIPEHISLNQDQYVKNIASRFEKSFKHEFKIKDNPLPNNFTSSIKDCPAAELQTKEVKIRFSILQKISAFLYVSSYTIPDITFAVNKLAKYSNSPSIVHYRAMLHLIGFLKGTSNISLKNVKVENSPAYKVLLENNITISEDTTTIFSD